MAITNVILRTKKAVTELSKFLEVVRQFTSISAYFEIDENGAHIFFDNGIDLYMFNTEFYEFCDFCDNEKIMTEKLESCINYINK